MAERYEVRIPIIGTIVLPDIEAHSEAEALAATIEWAVDQGEAAAQAVPDFANAVVIHVGHDEDDEDIE